MKQVVLRQPGQFVEQDVPEPQRKPGEALIRMESVGVCGSDFHAFTGSHPVYTYPRVLGHEMSATILEIPENEAGIRPGDRCAIEPYLSCGHCRACKRNRPNCCETLQLLGVHIDGGMQELLSVPVSTLHKSEKLSLDQLALVETLGIGANAVDRANIQPGEEVLVVGAGPIGLSVVQFAVAAGGRVRVLEKNEQRREFAKQFASETLCEPDGQLADVVFDATGHPQAMADSLYLVAPAGKLVFVGLCRGSIAIDDPTFHRREITLLASRNSCYQFPRIIRMIEEGVIDTAPWINARMPLRDVPTCFDALRSRPGLVKAIIEVRN